MTRSGTTAKTAVKAKTADKATIRIPTRIANHVGELVQNDDTR